MGEPPGPPPQSIYTGWANPPGNKIWLKFHLVPPCTILARHSAQLQAFELLGFDSFLVSGNPAIHTMAAPSDERAAWLHEWAEEHRKDCGRRRAYLAAVHAQEAERKQKEFEKKQKEMAELREKKRKEEAELREKYARLTYERDLCLELPEPDRTVALQWWLSKHQDDLPKHWPRDCIAQWPDTIEDGFVFWNFERFDGEFDGYWPHLEPSLQPGFQPGWQPAQPSQPSVQ